MNIGECMEYAQKIAGAESSKDRVDARRELRETIEAYAAAQVAEERERCAKVCEALAEKYLDGEDGRPKAWALIFGGAAIRAALKGDSKGGE